MRFFLTAAIVAASFVLGNSLNCGVDSVISTNHAKLGMLCDEQLDLQIQYWKNGDTEVQHSKIYNSVIDGMANIHLEGLNTCSAYTYQIVFMPAEGDPLTSSPMAFMTACVAVVLGRPTDTRIGMKLLSTTEIEIKYLQFATLPSTDPNAAPFAVPAVDPVMAANETKYLEFNGLTPNTKYYYSVRYVVPELGIETSTEEFAFHTARPTGETFRFVVMADTHFADPGHDFTLLSKNMDQMRQDAKKDDIGVDMFFDIGDTFMGAKLHYTIHSIYQPYQNLFHYFSRIGSFASFYHSTGNHDGELGWNIKTSNTKYIAPTEAVRYRKKYYAMPYPDGFYTGNDDTKFAYDTNNGFGDAGDYYQQDFYAFTWGNAMLVAITPFWYTRNKPTKENNGWEWSLGWQQYEWLHDTLAGTDATFKFVFCHNFVGGIWNGDEDKIYNGYGGEEWAQYFEWGGYGEEETYVFDEKRQGWKYGPIHNILRDNGVTAVFKGHDHLFHIGEYDGVLYYTLGQTSKNNPVFEADRKGHDFTRCKGHSGYLLVEPGTDQATIQYKNYRGEVMDMLTLFPDGSHSDPWYITDPDAYLNEMHDEDFVDDTEWWPEGEVHDDDNVADVEIIEDDDDDADADADADDDDADKADDKDEDTDEAGDDADDGESK
jgi:hypothetical protein